MAYDEGLAQMLRDDLAGESFIEKKMFGGVAFMFRGHMLCGVHKGGGMFRVGKDNAAEALKVPGARPMTFTGRPMGGMIECDPEVMADDAGRRRLLEFALAFNRSQAPK
jgi:hypothetical protein